MHVSRHRYLAFIPTKGPTGRERDVDLLPFPPDAVTGCAEEVGAARALGPSDPALEAAGDALASSAKELGVLVSENVRYYADKEFKDDSWAKGKDLHPRLVAAWARFASAETKLRDEVARATKAFGERLAQRPARRPIANTLASATTLFVASLPNAADDDVDATAYEAALAAFDKSFTELSQQSELLSGAFFQSARELHGAAKELSRCFRDAPRHARSPSGRIDLDKAHVCAATEPPKKLLDAAEALVTRFDGLAKALREESTP
jgi:hypothetical protein